MFTKINMETWSRRNVFHELTVNNPICFSVSHHFDITHFFKGLKARGQKFTPSILYAFSQILNRHKEFKVGVNEKKELGYYDVLHPCHTVFHEKEEIITLLHTEFNEDFSVFLGNYNDDMQKYAHKPFEPKALSVDNIFHISNAPWLPFDSVTLSCKHQYEYYTPMFSIGKYAMDNNKVLLPVAIHANHAVVDGFHVSRFFSELQDWLHDYST